MKRKGFTLIELLAVIVILAVIAIIVIPIINNVIEKSNRESVRATAYNYIDATEKAIVKKTIEKGNSAFEGEYLIDANNLVRVEPNDELRFEINLKNYNDISGELVIGKKGVITSAVIYQKGYEAIYNGKKVTIGKLGEIGVKKIMFDTDEMIAQVGQEEQLNLTIFPNSATNKKITYTSSDESVVTVNENGLMTIHKGGNVTITAASNNGLTDTIRINIKYAAGNIINADSIYDLMHDDGLIESGTYTIKLPNDQSFDAEIYLIDGNTVYETTPTLCDNVADTKMCIYKFNGNLTINSGVTLTPQLRKKGFTIYVNGTLTNNGTISMTARGAIATGQDVYLFKNADDTYEYVPAVGGAGGTARSGSNVKLAGIAGTNGASRQTGGGGSGAVYFVSCNGTSGAGGSGTSYSGGAGGGSAIVTGEGTMRASNGSSSGGAGGNANQTRPSITSCEGGGGAGNPGGLSGYGNVRAGSGTGGLLNIYATKIVNNGSFVSNGSRGGYGHHTYSGSQGNWNGGSSGGGSINLFYVDQITSGTITASGGVYANGGAGGKGSITIGSIATGTFVKD